mmetsp:Transcript_47901/g.94500  ORF Transcript_47901/g.94500 Transcript_47901/m.94500 type:complete len:252 (+) Transcript_47901:85-840(+)
MPKHLSSFSLFRCSQHQLCGPFRKSLQLSLKAHCIHQPFEQISVNHPGPLESMRLLEAEDGLKVAVVPEFLVIPLCREVGREPSEGQEHTEHTDPLSRHRGKGSRLRLVSTPPKPSLSREDFLQLWVLHSCIASLGECNSACLLFCNDRRLLRQSSPFLKAFLPDAPNVCDAFLFLFQGLSQALVRNHLKFTPSEHVFPPEFRVLQGHGRVPPAPLPQGLGQFLPLHTRSSLDFQSLCRPPHPVPNRPRVL